MERISLPERVDRFRQFYRGSLTDGPLVGFYYGSYYPFHRYDAGRRVEPGKMRPTDLDVDSFSPDYERLYTTYSACEGDFIWSGAAFWGVPWMEALAGCPVIADPEHGSARSEPVAAATAPTEYRLPPRAAVDGWFNLASSFLTRVGEISAGRFPLGTTLMRGISDVLSAIYGTPDFVFRLIDDPATTRIVVDQIVDRWIEFGDHQLGSIEQFHGGVGSYFYDMWLPGRGVFVQEDASALMSPDLFAESILPGITTILDHFDSAIIHLHPSSYIPIDHLLDSKLLAIELHRDLGGQSVEQLLPVYRTIQQKKPLVIWGDLSTEELELIKSSLDLNRLAIKPVVQSHEEAERIWRIFKG